MDAMRKKIVKTYHTTTIYTYIKHLFFCFFFFRKKPPWTVRCVKPQHVMFGPVPFFTVIEKYNFTESRPNWNGTVCPDWNCFASFRESKLNVH